MWREEQLLIRKLWKVQYAKVEDRENNTYLQKPSDTALHSQREIISCDHKFER